jgi:hypothetical protein
MGAQESKTYGMLAEFGSATELLQAAEKLRDNSYRDFDCHSPFPIHGMDQAMGLKRSPVGYVAGIGGLLGGGFALWLQWWTSTIDYPIVISGKPFFSYQAYVPVTFGLTVLFAALCAFFGMLIINRLPRYWHMVFHSDRFASVSDDGFFISVEATDPQFDETKTRQLLESIGASGVEVMRG